jgi:hypothetical protein
MRPPLASAVISLLCVVLIACESSCGSTRSSAGRTLPAVANHKAATRGDANDGDNDSSGGDDGLVLDYGHPAGAVEASAITATLRHYYAAATADNGVKVCSMLVVSTAETAAEQYGVAPGTSGKSCAVVISKVLKPDRRALYAKLSSLRVTVVRVGEEGVGLAVLGFAGNPEPRVVSLRRTDGAWRVRGLLDVGMP